jgi:hypothetical protein
MGRQTQLHLLPQDCRQLLSFIQQRDPVIVTHWHSSESAEIAAVRDPWDRPGFYCLWNQAILPSLERDGTGKYFNVNSSLPVIEFSYEGTLSEPWNGQSGLLQGRIWASFDAEDKSFERWYNAVVRWIRKNFVRDPMVGLDLGFIGPVAYDWFRQGGLMLPSFRPPVTESWLGWVDVQNQHRASLSKPAEK